MSAVCQSPLMESSVSALGTNVDSLSAMQRMRERSLCLEAAYLIHDRHKAFARVICSVPVFRAVCLHLSQSVSCYPIAKTTTPSGLCPSVLDLSKMILKPVLPSIGIRGMRTPGPFPSRSYGNLLYCVPQVTLTCLLKPCTSLQSDVLDGSLSWN